MSKKDYKYYQTAEDIAAYIKKKRLYPGAKLPGMRMLSSLFDVSNNTVLKAFEYLSDHDIITLKEKQGAYVAWGAWEEAEPRTLWNNLAEQAKVRNNNVFMNHCASVSPLNIAPSTVKFSNEFQADTYLSYALKDAYQQILREPSMNSVADMSGVKNAICEHLASKNIKADPDMIILTTGAMHGINMFLQTFMSKGMYLLIENPSLTHVVSGLISSLTGAKIAYIGMDDEGIRVDEIKKMQYRKNAILVLSSVHQQPTGISMSKARKMEILHLCKEMQIPIVELDHFSDIIKIDSIKAMDTEDIVVYSGTIRHIFALGLNVGWLVMPKYLVHKVKDVLLKTSAYYDHISHMILESLLSNGYYYSFLKNSTNLFEAKIDLTNQLLEKHLAQYISWDKKNSIFLFWLNFHDISIHNLLESMDSSIIATNMLFSPDCGNYLSLCPMSLTDNELTCFIEQIAEKVTIDQENKTNKHLL